MTPSVVSSRVTLVLATLLLRQPCMAQVDPWQRLHWAENGRRIEVENRAGKRVSGKLESWSPDSIRLRNRRGIQAFDRNEVARVVLVTGRSRGMKAAIAFGVTAAVFGALVGASCTRGCPEGTEAGIAAIPVTGGIAAGIAALFPPHREVLYISTGSASREGE